MIQRFLNRRTPHWVSCILALCLLASCSPQLLDMDEIIGGTISEQVIEGFPEFTYIAGFTQVKEDTFYVMGTRTTHNMNFYYDIYPGPWEIWYSEDGGMTWLQKEYAWLDNEAYISAAEFLPDGSLYFISSMNREPNEEYDTPAEDQDYEEYTIYSETDAYDVELAYGDQQGYQFHFGAKLVSYADQLLVTESGDVLIINYSSIYHLEIEHTDHTLYEGISRLDDGKAAVLGNRLAACYQNRIDMFDLERKERTESIPLPQLLVDNYVMAMNDAGFYVCSASEGLFHISLDGSMTEFITEGTAFVWGEENTRLKRMYVCGDGSLLLLAWRLGGYQLTRYHYDSEAVRIPEMEITVYSLHESPTLREYIRLYRRQEPNVLVHYHVGVTGTDAVEVEGAIATLAMELEAGYGPDLLLLDDISVNSFADSGYLMDISSHLPEDAALMPLVAEAYRGEEGIYAVPTRLVLPVIIGENASQLKGLEGICEAFEAWDGDFYSLTPELLTEWVCAVTNQGDNTNSEALQRLIRIHEFSNYYPTLAWEPDDALFWTLGETPYVLLISEDLSDITYFYSAVRQRGFGEVSVYPSDAGFYLPQSVLGINTASTKQEIAADFMQFCLVQETQAASNLSGIPVNTDAIEQILSSREPGSFYVQSVILYGDPGDFTIVWPLMEEQEHFKRLLRELSQVGFCK